MSIKNVIKLRHFSSGNNKDAGALHPINHMKDSILNLLVSFGFEIIDGPEIETEKFNFDMLNIKESHPLDKCMILFMLKKSNL